MQPKTNRPDGYTPRWRHFHTQSTVWAQNPLDHDVVFNVADEHDNSYAYRMKSGEISELPGGAVATLGVKTLVDELIQNNKSDLLRIYEPAVRAKYEDEIIMRIKDAPMREAKAGGGEIDLSMSKTKEVEEDIKPPTTPPPGTGYNVPDEEEFPALNPKEASAQKEALAVASATTSKLPTSKVIDD